MRVCARVRVGMCVCVGVCSNCVRRRLQTFNLPRVYTILINYNNHYGFFRVSLLHFESIKVTARKHVITGSVLLQAKNSSSK